MSWSVSLFLPLAAMAMDGAPATPHEGGSERFARVLVTSYVCETLGFGVNYEGLADWGRALQTQMVEEGATSQAALANIRSDVRYARDRFLTIHGQTLQTAAIADFNGGALNGVGVMDAQYRFQKSFTDRCNDLVATPDLGALFTAPERRLSGVEFSRTITSLYRGRLARP